MLKLKEAVKSKYAVHCGECAENFHIGWNNRASQSNPESIVNAYLHGWWVGRVMLCPKCMQAVKVRYEETWK